MSSDSFDFRSSTASDSAAVHAASLAPDERLRTAAGLRLSAEAGEIIAILARSETYRRMTLGDVEGIVRPALLTRQFCISRQDANNPAMGTSSAGVAFWASVSDAVDQRIAASLHEPIRLAANEWRSGPHVWLVDAVGEPSSLGPMLRHIAAVILKDQTIKARHRNDDRSWTVRTLPKAN